MYRPAQMECVAAEQPELRQDLGFQTAVLKNANHGGFRNYDRDGSSGFRDGGRSPMAAAQAEGDLGVFGGCIQISAGGNHEALIVEYEGTVQLGELFDGSAQIWIGDAPGGQRVKRDRIQD